MSSGARALLARALVLKAGDTMRLTVSGLGEQRQKVVDFRL